MAASALLSSLCLAASFAVPEMPEAEWDDTEVVTNAALPLLAGMGHGARHLPGHGFSEPRIAGALLVPGVGADRCSLIAAQLRGDGSAGLPVESFPLAASGFFRVVSETAP